MSNLQDLTEALEEAQQTLDKAERERDDWELDSDSESASDRYDQMLDEVNGDFLGMSASRILKEMDPIAYNCGFSDWADGALDGMSERDKRRMFPDFDELCEAVEEAEAERDEAAQELDEYEATSHSADPDES